MKSNNKIIKEIVDRWEKDESHYNNLQVLVYKFLEDSIFSLELYPTIYKRVKSQSSMIKTAIKKEKSYDEINDKLGLRIVVHFKSELEKIHKFIYENFEVMYYERKSDTIKYDQLGYLSDHYEVKVKLAIPYFSLYKEYEGTIFEIQVRTLCQHAWADIEHALMYKQELDIEETYKRRIFRLTSLLEICDDEFDSINNKIVELPEYNLLYLLKILEGKFYKYARRSYNKEISIDVLSKFIEIYKIADNHTLLKVLEDYFKENNVRITQIFIERVKELETNIFLSQPEIFFIWFLIENKQYDLIKLWKQYFDIEDLFELSVIWGKPINVD